METRIKISADYQRRNTAGGSPLGVKKLRWPLALKTVLHLWALENVVENDEHRFIHSPNVVKWSNQLFLGFLPVIAKLYPEFYMLLEHSCDDEHHMAFKVMQRHHKMFYQLNKGRQFSDEHPENMSRKSTAHLLEYQSGQRAYAYWKANK